VQIHLFFHNVKKRKIKLLIILPPYPLLAAFALLPAPEAQQTMGKYPAYHCPLKTNLNC